MKHPLDFVPTHLKTNDLIPYTNVFSKNLQLNKIQGDTKWKTTTLQSCGTAQAFNWIKGRDQLNIEQRKFNEKTNTTKRTKLEGDKEKENYFHLVFLSV